MGYLVRVVIPNHSVPCLHHEFIDKITKRWGGCTVFRANGFWNPEGKVDGQQQTVCDSVVICECSVGAYGQDAERWWYKLAQDVAVEFDQECVYMSVREEIALLISQDGSIRLLGGGENV